MTSLAELDGKADTGEASAHDEGAYGGGKRSGHFAAAIGKETSYIILYSLEEQNMSFSEKHSTIYPLSLPSLTCNPLTRVPLGEWLTPSLVSSSSMVSPAIPKFTFFENNFGVTQYTLFHTT